MFTGRIVFSRFKKSSRKLFTEEPGIGWKYTCWTVGGVLSTLVTLLAFNVWFLLNERDALRRMMRRSHTIIVPKALRVRVRDFAEAGKEPVYPFSTKPQVYLRLMSDLSAEEKR